jgi:hypothetical protein
MSGVRGVELRTAMKYLHRRWLKWSFTRVFLEASREAEQWRVFVRPRAGMGVCARPAIYASVSSPDIFLL